MRRDYQKTAGGLFFRQITNPVTHQRQRVSAPTIGELERRCQEIQRLKFDLEFGGDPAAAIRKLRPIMSGRGLTVSELWKRYSPAVPAKSAVKYRAAWRCWIERQLGSANPWELTEARMRTWEAGLQREGKSSNSIAFAFSTLKLIWRLAMSEGDVDRRPWEPWRPASPRRRHEPRYVARLDDLADLLMAAVAYDRMYWERGRYSHRFYVIGVMALTGLRHSEAVGLSWDCIELDTVPHRLRIWFQAPQGWWKPSKDRPWRSADRPRDPPKNGKKTVQLHETAAQLLRAQRAQLERFGWYRPDGPVFPDERGQWRRCGIMTVETLRKIVQSAGLPEPERWNLHSLRHSHSSLEVIFSGGDLRAASERTRHADLRVLQGYVHSGQKHDASFIPLLTSPALAPVLEAPIAAPVLAASDVGAVGSPGDLVTSIERVASRVRDEGQAPEVAPAGATIDDHAHAWIAAGKPPMLPVEVRDGFRRAYVRAYQRERRRGQPSKLCAAAGKRARRASQGAWAQAVGRVEQKAAKRTA